MNYNRLAIGAADNGNLEMLKYIFKMQKEDESLEKKQRSETKTKDVNLQIRLNKDDIAILLDVKEKNEKQILSLQADLEKANQKIKDLEVKLNQFMCNDVLRKLSGI